MHVISMKRLKDFWATHPKSERPLRAWFQIAERNDWGSLDDIRKTLPATDRVGKCLVFNIGGNHFRLIAYANFKYRKLYVLKVMTHAEYSKNRWKEECQC
jgi:mRNA interferase HigB